MTDSTKIKSIKKNQEACKCVVAIVVDYVRVSVLSNIYCIPHSRIFMI